MSTILEKDKVTLDTLRGEWPPLIFDNTGLRGGEVFVVLNPNKVDANDPEELRRFYMEGLASLSSLYLAAEPRRIGDGFSASVLEAAAQAAHEANRAWCLAMGDDSQPHWEEAPEWQKDSARKGVLGVAAGNGPRESHQSWLDEKAAAGWVYGLVKDPEAKTHPCLLPYDELPPEQRAKDAIYVAVVQAVLKAGA